MFSITKGDDGVVFFEGRFDATHMNYGRESLWSLDAPTRMDMSRLDYISSAGIGVIVEAARRLQSRGHDVRFVNLTPSVRNVLILTGLDRILQIE